jgi:SAM-dependent methyltransferase
VKRTPLPGWAVEQIRRARLAPSPTQWDYLHLAALVRGLGPLLQSDDFRGPTLDLYCGTQPYRELIRATPVWGVDLDRHFGRADLVGSVPLPFRNCTFGLILCTQALYLTTDPVGVVREMFRVLQPGGAALVTVPHLLRRELPIDRRYSPEQLAGLFRAWTDVRVSGLGGPGTGVAYILGTLGAAAARRSGVARGLSPPLALALNGAGAVLNVALRPLARRWPASLILQARRPED